MPNSRIDQRKIPHIHPAVRSALLEVLPQGFNGNIPAHDVILKQDNWAPESTMDHPLGRDHYILHLSLTTQCYPSPNVLCINSYLSALPYHFSRTPPANGTPATLPEIQLPPAYSRTTATLATTPFLLFDAARRTEVLGVAPAYDFKLAVSAAVREAPVYVAAVQ